MVELGTRRKALKESALSGVVFLPSAWLKLRAQIPSRTRPKAPSIAGGAAETAGVRAFLEGWSDVDQLFDGSSPAWPACRQCQGRC